MGLEGGWGFRRQYLERLWAWWAVPHVEHGGSSESPLWVALNLTTVPYVTNLKTESVQSGLDTILNNPAKQKGERKFREALFQGFITQYSSTS